jgi:thiamine-phosphate pyrophosphorylase
MSQPVGKEFHGERTAPLVQPGLARIGPVGVGGIEAANAAQVLAAGAAGVAVISAVGAAEDPVGATRLLAEVVSRWRSEER